MFEWTMFGHSRVRLEGVVFAPSTEVAEKIRALILNKGGQIENAGGNVVVYGIPAHRMMGVGSKFGTWYGRVPLRIKVTVTPSNGGEISQCEIECDLAKIRRRFQTLFFVLSGVVFVLLVRAIVLGGQEMDVGWMAILALPYVIFEGNFLSFRLYLPSRLRKFFAEVLEW